MDYSRLTLYKNIQFPRDYSHILHFSNVTEQKSYFSQSSLIHSTYTNFLYIEKSRKIVVDKVAGELLGVNYLSFINGDNSKVYYAFVDDLIYESDGSTTLLYTIDIMQTYMFDYELGNCDVTREHSIRFNSSGKRTNNDMFTGEPFLCNNDLEYKHMGDLYSRKKLNGVGIMFLVLYCNQYLGTSEEQDRSLQILPTYAVPISDNGNHVSNENADVFASYEEIMRSNFMANNVVGAQLVTNLPANFTLSTYGSGYLAISGIRTVNVENLMLLDISGLNLDEISTSLYCGRITPSAVGFSNARTNKNLNFENSKSNFYKINSSQFKSIGVSTLGNIDYLKPELITENVNVHINTTLSTPIAQYLTFDNYIYDETSAKTMGKFFQNNNNVPIRQEVFYQWLVTSGLSGSLNTIESNIRSGLGNFGGWGALIGAGIGTLKVGEQIVQKLIEPDKAINPNNQFCALKYKEGYDIMVFSAEIKNKDIYLDYFQKYGYNISRNKIPNIKTHYWFNYIQNANTALINVKNMTHNIIEAIKQIYNNGVTLWHYNNGNYKWINYDCNNIERSIAT